MLIWVSTTTTSTTTRRTPTTAAAPHPLRVGRIDKGVFHLFHSSFICFILHSHNAIAHPPTFGRNFGAFNNVFHAFEQLYVFLLLTFLTTTIQLSWFLDLAGGGTSYFTRILSLAWWIFASRGNYFYTLMIHLRVLATSCLMSILRGNARA